MNFRPNICIHVRGLKPRLKCSAKLSGCEITKNTFLELFYAFYIMFSLFNTYICVCMGVLSYWLAWVIDRLSVNLPGCFVLDVLTAYFAGRFVGPILLFIYSHNFVFLFYLIKSLSLCISNKGKKWTFITHYYYYHKQARHGVWFSFSFFVALGK